MMYIHFLFIFQQVKHRTSIMEDTESCYKEQYIDGQRQYVCNLCGRTLSRKQRILTHLVSNHQKSKLSCLRVCRMGWCLVVEIHTGGRGFIPALGTKKAFICSILIPLVIGIET